LRELKTFSGGKWEWEEVFIFFNKENFRREKGVKFQKKEKVQNGTSPGEI
jgi:hypothetical protein